MGITEHLFSLSDPKHAEFCSKLMPTVDKNIVLGIKTPILRKYASKIYGTNEARNFMSELPHQYFEENNLHAFLIEMISDFDECITEIERFLPYVDNWATCDSMRPKIFKKNTALLKEKAEKWLESENVYTVRFGIEMFMVYFLDDEYSLEYSGLITQIRSDEYYIKMMVAWYFATALAKKYDSTLPFIENKALDDWTHNKAIQKAIESYRITKEQKEYLKTLKIKK